MRRVKILLVIFALFSLLSACDEGIRMTDFEISPTDVNITELVTRNYPESALRNICDLEGDISKFHNKYPVECIRSDGLGYTVVYRGSSHVAEIWFNLDGQKEGSHLIETKHTAAELMEIKIGCPWETVRSLFPEGVDLFMTGRDDSPRVSYYYTVDGYRVHVSYDDNFQVEDISTELI